MTISRLAAALTSVFLLAGTAEATEPPKKGAAAQSISNMLKDANAKGKPACVDKARTAAEQRQATRENRPVPPVCATPAPAVKK